MRILVDECMPKRLVAGLRARGHDVVWARDVCAGNDDSLVLGLANAELRVVVSEDRDFGMLSVKLELPAFGVILVHTSEFAGSIGDVISAILQSMDTIIETAPGHLTTIEPGRVRRRLLPNPIIQPLKPN